MCVPMVTAAALPVRPACPVTPSCPRPVQCRRASDDPQVTPPPPPQTTPLPPPQTTHSSSSSPDYTFLFLLPRLHLLFLLLIMILYLLSPLDLVPESVFGLLGLLDDLAVILLMLVFVTIIYRAHMSRL